MKNDIRSRYTRETIMKVFIELIKQKPVEKITVKEVCEKAQINRSTFYKYFLDCYDVKEQLENSALDKFDEILKKMSDGEKDPERLVLSMLYFLMENPDMTSFAGRKEQRQDFLSRFVGRAYQQLDRWLDKEDIDPAMKMQAMAYIVQGSVGVIAQWLYLGMKDDPKLIAAALMRFAKAIIDKA